MSCINGRDHCWHEHDDANVCCECGTRDEVVQTISLKDFILFEATKQQWPTQAGGAAGLLNELKETK